jgi:MoxR-like ATPase
MTPEIRALLADLEGTGYIAEPATATALFLARAMQKPLLIEGDAGVGKTELAKVLARLLGTELIRLQCYEGLDVQTSLYEWDYPRQMLRLRMSQEAARENPQALEAQIFSREYLLERPLLRAITRPGDPPVLLIDEIDRADDGFEAFLLELLSDFQVTIPELGTIKAARPPIVVLTSNRTRELGDALRRRCLYLYLDHPSLEREVRIIRARCPEAAGRLPDEIARFLRALRARGLVKPPGVAETLDFTRALLTLRQEALEAEVVTQTLGCLLKDRHDIETVTPTEVAALLASARESVRS